MRDFKDRFKSIRVKLFLTLSITIIIIIAFLILLNSAVLETFYLYSKTKTLKETFYAINDYYNNSINNQVLLERELQKIALSNNFDILISTDAGMDIYTSNRDFRTTLEEINAMSSDDSIRGRDILFKDKQISIKKASDKDNDITYILLISELDNGYQLFIRIPIASIQESVKISNNFLYLIGGVAIILSAIMVSYITKLFTEPILELNVIAKHMSRLDFSKKYESNGSDDEINNLGTSINTMSNTLEKTIKQLKETNLELEKDIEEKSKIDEMRKQFISDVSHELKTPIALIQGYAEGLQENINTDEESRKFYTEVILDEASKMDKLVKQLLELMKLEYGNREFSNTKFDINELITEVIRKSKVMLDENNIKIEFKQKDRVFVYADDFYIEQVITNYFTNAIKHVLEKDGEKYIKIHLEIRKNKKVRISVFNTGNNISEENINRIWNRFYKEDESRKREDSGSGVGLSLVKAIMNNYQNEYGMENKDNGVEFYFELDLAKEEEQNEKGNEAKKDE